MLGVGGKKREVLSKHGKKSHLFLSIVPPLYTWAAISKPAVIWVVSDVSLLQVFV